MVCQMKTDFVMVKNEAIFAEANTIKQLRIYKNMHMPYKQDFYKTKEKGIVYLFLKWLVPVMKNIEHPALIKESIQNIDAAAHETNL